jgi:hypothetical protein
MIPLMESQECMALGRKVRRSDNDRDADRGRELEDDTGSSKRIMDRLKGLFDW